MSLSNLIEIATDEKQTEDDWTKILDVCEKGTSSPKECLKLILRRMFNRNPHVVLRSLILLDACAQNIGESFAREISSRYFVTEIKNKSKGMHQKALERLCFMIKKWSREFNGSEFDFINELNKWLQDTYPGCYAAGDDELNSRNSGKLTRKVVAKQEEADIAKAIALSLQETESKRATLYPTTSTNIVPETAQSKKSMTKVRAIYDFEAAEENELTFKAGEIIINVDTSNEHWWTGSNHRGEGMFPAQFVTLNLEANIDKSHELVQPSNEKNVVQDKQQTDAYFAQTLTPVIDESRIDECIHLIEDADPTGEMRPDLADLAKGEAQCRLMGPLIDQELEKIDRHYNRFVEINGKIIDSFQMYNDLMTQSVGIRAPNYMWQPQFGPAQYSNMYPDHCVQGMNPGQAQPMHNNPQQSLPQDPMRFQPINYYAGVDNIQNQELRNNQEIMNHHQSQTMMNTSPYPMHNNSSSNNSYTPATYQYTSYIHPTENNISYVQK